MQEKKSGLMYKSKAAKAKPSVRRSASTNAKPTYQTSVTNKPDWITGQSSTSTSMLTSTFKTLKTLAIRTISAVWVAMLRRASRARDK